MPGRFPSPRRTGNRHRRLSRRISSSCSTPCGTSAPVWKRSKPGLPRWLYPPIDHPHLTTLLRRPASARRPHGATPVGVLAALAVASHAAAALLAYRRLWCMRRSVMCSKTVHRWPDEQHEPDEGDPASPHLRQGLGWFCVSLCTCQDVCTARSRRWTRRSYEQQRLRPLPGLVGGAGQRERKS